ncbi:MAG TPA: phosphatidate cytidylyltransferase [Thermomicrobiaceae bacterium]|nr:phosphatidate cytidylyltransferase [Thermomicrobiaceae bacterium]
MLKTRAVSAVGVVVVAACAGFAGGPVLDIVVAILGFLGLEEMFRALAVIDVRPLRAVAWLGAITIIILAASSAGGGAVSAAIVAFILVSFCVAVLRPDPIPGLIDWCLTAGLTLYLALPLATFIMLRQLGGASTRNWSNRVIEFFGFGTTGRGLAWFAMTLAAVWISDTAAYLVGRQWGKTKLIPAVSPGKTRVGAAGAVVGGAAGALVFAYIFGTPISWYLAVSTGVILSVAGQLGDLAESLIKRSLNIKDMGNLIPGHGGILDRIDALLFAMPVAYGIAWLLAEVRLS